MASSWRSPAPAATTERVGARHPVGVGDAALELAEQPGAGLRRRLEGGGLVGGGAGTTSTRLPIGRARRWRSASRWPQAARTCCTSATRRFHQRTVSSAAATATQAPTLAPAARIGRTSSPVSSESGPAAYAATADTMAVPPVTAPSTWAPWRAQARGLVAVLDHPRAARARAARPRHDDLAEAEEEVAEDEPGLADRASPRTSRPPAPRRGRRCCGGRRSGSAPAPTRRRRARCGAGTAVEERRSRPGSTSAPTCGSCPASPSGRRPATQPDGGQARERRRPGDLPGGRARPGRRSRTSRAGRRRRRGWGCRARASGSTAPSTRSGRHGEADEQDDPGHPQVVGGLVRRARPRHPPPARRPPRGPAASRPSGAGGAHAQEPPGVGRGELGEGVGNPRQEPLGPRRRRGRVRRRDRPVRRPGGAVPPPQVRVAVRVRVPRPRESMTASPRQNRRGNAMGRTPKPLATLTCPQRAVAQLVEHRSPKPAVGGSSPSCPAPRTPTHSRDLRVRHGDEPRAEAHAAAAGRARRRRRARRASAPAPRHAAAAAGPRSSAPRPRSSSARCAASCARWRGPPAARSSATRSSCSSPSWS